MRALLSIFSTLVLLITIFFFVAVWRAQPHSATPASAGPPLTAAVLSATTTKSGVGEGTRPSLQKFENGRLVSELNADDYTPQKDGSFYVTNLVYIYYMNDGQRLRVTGDYGTLYCDTSSKASDTIFVGTNTSPRNGWLHHVHLELYHDEASTRPNLWMDTDNIHFDNDTLRMYTESFRDPVTGKTIPADQVPVAVRGDDYEFDGNGLTVLWNGSNRRLQKLLVNHGKRLEIKNPSKLSLPGMSPAEPEGKVAQAFAFPELLASIDPSAVSMVIDKKPSPVQPVQPPTPYRAVFNDNVEIKDTVRTLATADVMVVDFLQGANKPQPEPAPTPKTTLSPTTTPVLRYPDEPGVAPASPAPLSHAGDTSEPASSDITKTAKSSATQPVNGPVTITWTGKLLVTPLDTEPMMPLLPGQSVVRLIGAPVRLTPEGSVVLAATATYRNPDGAVALESPRGGLVRMTRDTGMTLTTGSLVYDPATSLATLLGPSHLEQPMGDQMMTVDWSRTGRLHMIKTAGQSQPSGIDQINLAGNVAVKDPQFSLDSQRLQLNLQPAKGKGDGEQLKLLTADDYVRCRLNNPGAPPDKGIDSNHLEIHTEVSGKQTVAREVIAIGDVRAFDPEQSLTAGLVDALLLPKTDAAPATNPSDEDAAASVDLESLHAKSNVHAVLKNGSTSDSEELRITGTGSKQLVELFGPGGAMLKDGKGSWLKGPVIHIVPASSAVSVKGPGSMETVRASAATRPADKTPPKVFDVAWADSMSMDASANIVDLYGHVMAKNLDPGGTLSVVTGDKAHLDLMDPPKATTKPAAAASDSMASAIGGKQLQKLTMTGHIVGTSDLNAPNGSILRQGRLYCERLIYLPIDGSAIIPVPGKMYVENHVAKDNDPGGSKGTMAISWQKQLVYNDAARTITFTGNTVVGFEQDQSATKPAKKPATTPAGGGLAQGPMQLRSDQLVVELAPAAPSAPAKKAKTTAAPQQKISKMTATGRVHFMAKGIELTCTKAVYEPATTILTATGSGNEYVDVLAGDMAGLFDKVVYNATTEEVLSATGSHVRAGH